MLEGGDEAINVLRSFECAKTSSNKKLRMLIAEHHHESSHQQSAPSTSLIPILLR
jgi:hypothetical protein